MSETVTISTKYQVVIPKRVREWLKLRPGMKLHVFEKGGHIHLIPELPLEEYRGRFPGVSSEGLRDKDDRF